MPNYRRQRTNGASYFFTINLLERRKSLLTDHIELLRESVRAVKKRLPFHIYPKNWVSCTIEDIQAEE